MARSINRQHIAVVYGGCSLTVHLAPPICDADLPSDDHLTNVASLLPLGTVNLWSGFDDPRPGLIARDTHARDGQETDVHPMM